MTGSEVEPSSNNKDLRCQSAVTVAIGAKGLSGALSNRVMAFTVSGLPFPFGIASPPGSNGRGPC